jgi:hypothetical protein
MLSRNIPFYTLKMQRVSYFYPSFSDINLQFADVVCIKQIEYRLLHETSKLDIDKQEENGLRDDIH